MPTHPSEPGTTLAPLAESQRIVTMDVLRGFALLGIWLMNIEGQAGPLQGSLTGVDPGLRGADRMVDWLIYVLVQGKFMPMFALLFGMGFAVMLQRAAQHGRSGAWLYARRLLVLLGFGLVHALLIWPGDVLIAYALMGLVLLACFRNTGAAALRRWSIGLMAGVVVVLGLLGVLLQAASSSEQGRAMLAEQATQVAATLQAQRLAYGSGSFAQATALRVSDTADMLSGLPVFGTLVLAMCLLGASLVRSGVMQAPDRHLPLFRRWLVIGALLGLPLMLASVAWRPSVDMAAMDLPSMLAQMLQLVAGVLMCLGYVGAIVLAMQRPVWAARLQWLAPAGRMALTNYLAQSLVATFLFYGYGLGGFEQLPRAWQPLLVLVLFGVQVAASHWWLRRYRFGPLEWLWRWLTYGHRPALLRAE